MSGRGNEDTIIGANLKKFRETYNINRKDLAGIFHISEDAVYRIEKGDTGLSSSYGYILANELHCDMNFIYGSTEVPKVMDEWNTDQISLEHIAKRLRAYAELLDKMAKTE